MSIFCCLGPLFRISLLSTVSPCLLSPEDQKAATSYKKLNEILSKGIIWHKTPTSGGGSGTTDDDDDGASGGGGGFSVGQFLGTSTPTVKIKSDLRIVDGPLGSNRSPRIEIAPCNNSNSNNNGKSRNDYDDGGDDDDDTNEMDPLCQKTRKKKTITVPLSQISICEVVSPSIATTSVSSVSSWLSKNVTGTSSSSSSSSSSSRMVVVYGKQSEHNPEGQGDELLRWEHPSGGDDHEETVVDYLTILLEWDRLRRKTEDNDDDDEEEEDEEGNNNNNNNNSNATSPTAATASSSSSGKKTKKKGFLKTQAEKAAHFAKREIEMRERRREREQRKAKYLKEAGGLKYTAIAMANRET